MTKLAIIDDDIEIRQLLSHYLTKQGFTVSIFPDGESFLKSTMNQYELAILDIYNFIVVLIIINLLV